MNKFKLIVYTVSGKKYEGIYDTSETKQEFLNRTGIDLKQETICINGMCVFTSKIESYFVQDVYEEKKRTKEMIKALGKL